MSKTGTFTEKSFSKMRKFVVESSEYGLSYHHMKGLLEIDVTEARKLIEAYKERTGKNISFTGWIMKCLGTAVNEHKAVHALRYKRKLIIFDDVDISVMVERIIDGRSFPVLTVIRKTNEKSVFEINEEIRKAQTISEEEMSQDKQKKRGLQFLSLPKFLRYLFFWRRLKRNPFFRKRFAGTISVTSVGMFGKGTGWAIPLSTHCFSVVLGGIKEKPGAYNGE
ncbi:MAG TPA: 2-oxo acid dehydrogenase subunit E2, partial [Candidatus Bathyarchaeia archaeon]|nr:2-oxo acid dehydrogenase subunit E2 [Candidatus Bathyarchaeia archaeon]